MFTFARIVAVLAAFFSCSALAGEFTWHGSLEDAGEPAVGQYDFRIQLFSAEQDGIRLSEPLELLGVEVAAGSFSADLELAGGTAERGGWLEVAVRSSGEKAYRALPGRSKLALEATAGACWNLSGNAGVLAGDFLGTTDVAALQFRVGNQRALQIVPASIPNLIGGYSGNLTGSVYGASIAGGGSSGSINQVHGSYGSIGGGQGNRVDASWGTVAGGRHNLAAGPVDSTVSGGSSNHASGQTSAVGGGFDNIASGLLGTIAGGMGNRAGGESSTIGGGNEHVASGLGASVGGGYKNTASGSSSVVAGGADNSATGNWSTVAGGIGNRATVSYSSVAGGNNNLASGNSAHVAGGSNNIASGSHAQVQGGRNNLAGGAYSTVAGGEDNCTGARWSWVGGRQARLISSSVPTSSPCYSATAPASWGEGTFMWAGGDVEPMYGLGYPSNSFVVRASGGTFFYSSPYQGPGVRLAPNAGDWSSLSDRNSKDDIEALDTAAVLDALLQMPVYRWRWKGEDEGNRHIGPMAQDFHAAYGLNGDDDTHLMSVDTNGVALAAIQGLHARLERENAQLRAELAALAERQQQLLARLDAMDTAQYAARRVALQATAQASTVPAALAGVQ